MTEYISYLRVSTTRQEKSGLGLEAQRKMIEEHLGEQELIAEYVEAESGRKSDRPQLLAALAHAKKIGAVLLVAKLDRLARNARFLLTVIESGADVMFCDLPQIPTGAIGKFMLSVMAAVAELESGLISERTKAAMAVAKERGTELGANGKKMAKVNRKAALYRAEKFRTLFQQMADEGTTTPGKMARRLNGLGIKTSTGGIWHPETVKRVKERLSA